MQRRLFFWLGNHNRSQVDFERRAARDASRLALLQVSLWSGETDSLTIVGATIHWGYTVADPVSGIASLLLLAAMLLFAYYVFCSAISVVPAATGRMTPAE
jgi:hypothetical protein